MTTPQALQKYLTDRVDRLKAWCTEAVAPEDLVRFALLDVQQSSGLQRASQESIYLSLITCASWGLRPGKIHQEAYIIPYGTVAMPQPSYRGLCKLACRGPAVDRIYAGVAHENDHQFEVWEGTRQEIIHRPAFRNRGPEIAAYAVAVLANGDRQFAVMDWEEIMKVKRIADAKKESPAWREWPGEMAKKTVVKRLCKMLPTGEVYAKAEVVEAFAHNQDVAGFRQFIDIETESLESDAVEALPTDNAERHDGD